MLEIYQDFVGGALQKMLQNVVSRLFHSLKNNVWNWNPSTNPNRKTFGINFIGKNLNLYSPDEVYNTPIVRGRITTKYCCEETKKN